MGPIVDSRLLRTHGSQLQAVSLEVFIVKPVLSAFTSINPKFYWFALKCLILLPLETSYPASGHGKWRPAGWSSVVEK